MTLRDKLTRIWISFRYAFNPRKPLMMLRLVHNFILVAILKRRLLRYVDTCIGYKCNLQCEHCFTAGRTEGAYLTPAVFARAAQEAMGLGAINFSFQGGEALLNPKLAQYVAAAEPALNVISITTNGTLLTLARAKELKRMGVDIVTISVDEFHQRAIDKSHHVGLVSIDTAIHNAQSAGLKVTLATVITRKNFNSVLWKYLTDHARKQKIIVMAIFAAPLGVWRFRQDLMLDESQLEQIRMLEKAEPYVRTDFSANYCTYGCGAGKEIIYLDPIGNVYCCPFVPFAWGNMAVEGLGMIRKRMLGDHRIKVFNKYCMAVEKESGA